VKQTYFMTRNMRSW